MIASMTAFACKTEDTPFGSMTWEIRSVNHRYLDCSVRLPELLRSLEKTIRDVLQKRLQRGKVEAVLRLQFSDDIPGVFSVNPMLLKQLALAVDSLKPLFPSIQVNATDILSWPGLLSTKEKPLEKLSQSALDVFEITLSELVMNREREGKTLKKYLEERLKGIEKQIKVIQHRIPAVLETAHQKIRARFDELSLSLDKDRLEQEMLWLIQKSDVSEELQRLDAHVIEMHRILKLSGAVGRRLDFLAQELNREANTLGSKSIDAELTQAAVELKVFIEQIREQVQNIE